MLSTTVSHKESPVEAWSHHVFFNGEHLLSLLLSFMPLDSDIRAPMLFSR